MATVTLEATPLLHWAVLPAVSARQRSERDGATMNLQWRTAEVRVGGQAGIACARSIRRGVKLAWSNRAAPRLRFPSGALPGKALRAPGSMPQTTG
jgi:hypothetical protein